MVRVRLTRFGSKKRPFYKIVVSDKRSPRDSKFIEQIGYFNPIASGKEKKFNLNLIRVKYWINIGAKLSIRVLSLMKKFNY